MTSSKSKFTTPIFLTSDEGSYSERTHQQEDLALLEKRAQSLEHKNTHSLSESSCQLTCADAVRWLSTLPSESADLIITDPPYESLEKHRARGTTTRLKVSKASSNPWFAIFPNSRLQELFQQCYRVLRKNTHLYVFCDPETTFTAKPIGEQCGFKFWKPIVWDKKTIGMGYHYRARYEFILFFEKGRRKLNNLSVSDIIEQPRIRGGYPTEKPVTVSQVLVLQSSQPHEVIVDPFCGSGSVGEAAIRNERRFLGCDIEPQAVKHAHERIARVLNQPR